ncbi:Hypothetical predicted protein [Pelobates cultripes]|uniref:Uncharacterized protein n=1 Tax=Pelobates cultripes TaxID=61616 RepID=A0AAD1RH72_PELCU|nr:Hypothetical predicted protein [Pelobates cultripes]
MQLLQAGTRASKMAVRQNRFQRALIRETATHPSNTRSHPHMSNTGTSKQATHSKKPPDFDFDFGHQHSTKHLSSTTAATQAARTLNIMKRPTGADPCRGDTKPC